MHHEKCIVCGVNRIDKNRRKTSDLFKEGKIEKISAHVKTSLILNVKCKI
jgi:hypothetical protein